MKFISFFALLVLELASTRTSARDIRNSCPRACNLLYSPICGYDPETNEYKTFSNKCVLGAENDCNKRSYKILYPGECPACFACKCAPDQPVCAFDYQTGSYQTFPCNCTLEKENVCPSSNTPRDNFEYRYDGECKCPIQCTQESRPVCAKSSVYGYYQTFNSKCSLEMEMKCNPNNAGFVFKHDGFCECPQFCTMDYTPVCAMNHADGKEVTFGNKCAMDAANKCPEDEIETHDRIRYSFLRMGECVPQIPQDGETP